MKTFPVPFRLLVVPALVPLLLVGTTVGLGALASDGLAYSSDVREIPLTDATETPTATATAPSTSTATSSATATSTPTPPPTRTPTGTATETPTRVAPTRSYLPILFKPWATPTRLPTFTPEPTATWPPTWTPEPQVTPTTTPVPPPSGDNVVCRQDGAAQLCAWVSDGAPRQYSNLTVYGRLLVNGAGQYGQPMNTTWHYRTTTSACSGTTGSSGIASCTRGISRATLGYRVDIDVSIGGYQATTWFVPR
ncbi:MAG: hypothetical protein M5U01_09700 [Ardenticatenaceae bacterium]|nr:hypothetical protein [Ardenticatenaceae bacterium]